MDNPKYFETSLCFIYAMAFLMLRNIKEGSKGWPRLSTEDNGGMDIEDEGSYDDVDAPDNPYDKYEDNPAYLFFALGSALCQSHAMVLAMLRAADTMEWSVAIVKSLDSLEVALSQENEYWYRQCFRMSKFSFEMLLRTISTDEVFRPAPTGRPQRPVRVQLAIFLQYVGSSNHHHLHIARLGSIGAGTVYKYLGRVLQAILNLESRFLKWPGPERRKEIGEEFEWEGAVGAVDGTLIKIHESPRKDGLTYHCRKKFIAINVQAVVDHEGYFISYEAGWPGSKNDIAIFKASHLWIKRHLYLGKGEYLLADKGYMVTPYTVRPFAENEMGIGPVKLQRRRFNKRHSRARIIVEHVFGNLKGRFRILKDMPGRSMGIIYRIVIGLMILHNVLKTYDDSTDDFACDYDAEADDYDEQMFEAHAPNVGGSALERRIWEAGAGQRRRRILRTETDERLMRRGRALRERLVDMYV